MDLDLFTVFFGKMDTVERFSLHHKVQFRPCKCSLCSKTAGAIINMCDLLNLSVIFL